MRTNASIRPSFQQACCAVQACERSKVHSASVLAVSGGTEAAAREVTTSNWRATAKCSQPVRRVVVETPHAWVGTEVVVERAVLLHEHDNMLDCAKIRTCRLDGRDIMQSPSRRRAAREHGTGSSCCGHRPEELPAVHSPVRHGSTVSRPYGETAGGDEVLANCEMVACHFSAERFGSTSSQIVRHDPRVCTRPLGREKNQRWK